MDVLSTYAYLKEIADAAENLAGQLKGRAIEEAQKYIGKDSGETTLHGVKYTVRGGRKLWDYSTIPAHAETKTRLSEIEKLGQAAYEMSLKGRDVIDENGEVVPPAIMKGVTETSLSVKIV